MKEDIKVLEEYLNYEVTKRKLSGCEILAIENLIARNKELEKLVAGQNGRGQTLHNLMNAEGTFMYKEICKNFIPKSKVREKIEELKNEIKENRSIASRTADRVEARILNDQINELHKAIIILEELLQEGDK